MVPSTGPNGYSSFSPLGDGAVLQQQQTQRQPPPPARTQLSPARPDEQSEGHHYRNPLMDGVAPGAGQPQPEPPPVPPSPPVQLPRKPPASLGVAGLLRREQQKATATDRCRPLDIPSSRESLSNTWQGTTQAGNSCATVGRRRGG